ncbi:MAG: glycosyltransferase [Anaerolineales bacterium]|nr:glycosyltransferase [Anaerolineales bacterium]
MTVRLPERVGIQQRVLPVYRAAFFDSLARALPGRLSVFAGFPGPREGIPQAQELRSAVWVRAGNRPLGAGRFSMLWQSGWRDWLAAEDPQAVVLEANPRYLSNYCILRRMRTRKRPVIGWSLGPARAAGIPPAWMRAFYGGFSAIVVYSGGGAQAFRDLGIDGGKIFTAPNAVESKTAEELLGRSDSRAAARSELQLDDRPVILFVGRLQPRKRVDSLLRACAREGGGCQLLIVGDGEDRARLERTAARTFPAARFTGDLRGEALGKCFLAADLFVLPGTGGLALQEAMLYGKAVAAAEADGSQKDLIREGGNGWLLPPGDEDALWRMIHEALRDPVRLAEMGEASRRRIRGAATMEKMVEGFLEALRFACRPKERRI